MIRTGVWRCFMDQRLSAFACDRGVHASENERDGLTIYTRTEKQA